MRVVILSLIILACLYGTRAFAAPEGPGGTSAVETELLAQDSVGETEEGLTSKKPRPPVASLADPSLVDNTSWSVAAVEQGVVGSPHPVPWVFHPDHTVNAGGLWSGKWSYNQKDSVTVYIPANHDQFVVRFNNQNHFDAYKGSDWYRSGTRVRP